MNSEDLDEIVRTQRFVPAKGFQGADAQPGQAPRQDPVKSDDEDDIFCLAEFQGNLGKSKESKSHKRRLDATDGHSSSKRPLINLLLCMSIIK